MDIDKSWIPLERHDRRYALGVLSFMKFAQDNANGSIIYCPCNHCKCASERIGFRHRKYLNTLRVMGFGGSTEFGYTTVSHHQALRMIMVNSPMWAVAVHPTIQQQLYIL